MRRVSLGAAAVVALVAAVPAMAGGQTTTTSTTATTTTTVAQTTTSTSPTTTSTMPHRCVGQPCAERPPDAVFVAASGQVTADRSGFCWQRPELAVGVCTVVARPENYQPPTLVVTQGEVVTIRFVSTPLLTPTSVRLVRQEQTITLPASNPTSFRADFPAGTRVAFELSAGWLQGDSGYSVGFDVRSAGRSISLTG